MVLFFPSHLRVQVQSNLPNLAFLLDHAQVISSLFTLPIHSCIVSNFSIKALNILAVVFENSLNTLITVAYLSLRKESSHKNQTQTLFSFCLLTCLVIFLLKAKHTVPLQYSCLENPHGQRSLKVYSPWDRKESDRTERLSTAQARCIR